MEMKEFLELTMELFAEAEMLLKSKNEDYAKQEDAFKNLNRTSQMVEVLDLDLSKREHIPLYEIVKKVHRLVNLGDTKPQHESRKDNCLDIIVFAILYYGMMIEERTK